MGGALFINTGTIIFQGNSTISGSRLAPGAAGTPDANAGTIAGSDIFLLSGSGLIFAPITNEVMSLSGSIADDSLTSIPGGNGITPGSGTGGAIVKNGAGTLILQGASTYSGGTALNAGTLNITGQIVGPLTSQSGSFLKGTGSVGDATLQGTLSPGDNAIGTLNFNSIDFETGSILTIELNSSQASLVEVKKGVDIIGPTTIIVTPDLGSYLVNTKYKIIESSIPITGVNFLSVQSTNPNFIFLLDTSIPNEVQLKLVSPLNLEGCRLSNKFLTQTEYVNVVTWNPSKNVTSYKIYRDPNVTDMIVEIPASGPYKYMDRHCEKDKAYTYYMVVTNHDGTHSTPMGVKIMSKDKCH